MIMSDNKNAQNHTNSLMAKKKKKQGCRLKPDLKESNLRAN